MHVYSHYTIFSIFLPHFLTPIITHYLSFFQKYCYNDTGDNMITRTKENDLKYCLKGTAVIFIYFLFSIGQEFPFILLHINVADLPSYITIMYSLAVELLMISLIFCIFDKELKNAFTDFKKNHLTYFNKYLKYYIISVVVMMVSNILINILGGGMSTNETTIRNEFNVFPIFTFISAVILAPILEESVFRLGFRAIISNDFLFITISSLIFGGLHLLGTPINELLPLYLLSYCSCGIAFAYMLKKTNNIFVSMFFHFMHNGLILSLQTFLLIFS